MWLFWSEFHSHLLYFVFSAAFVGPVLESEAGWTSDCQTNTGTGILLGSSAFQFHAVLSLPPCCHSLRHSGAASVCCALPVDCARWPFISKGPALMTHHDRFLLSVRHHRISSQHLRLSLPLSAATPQSFPVLFHENENKKMRIFIFFLDFLPDSHACFDSEIKR